MGGLRLRAGCCTARVGRGLAVATLFLYHAAAWADAGIPVVLIIWPWGAACAFFPIIFIEWLVVSFFIRNISSGRALYVTAMANLFSTVVGIPLAMLLRFGLEMVTLLLLWDYNNSHLWFWRFICEITVGAAWLDPYERARSWMIGVAVISLLLPCLWVSYFSERLVFRKMLGYCVDDDLVKKAVWYANVASYCVLLMLILFLLVKGIMRYGIKAPY